MGTAIIKGLAAVPDVTALAYDPDTRKTDALAGDNLAQKAASPKDLATGCDYLLLCVKPQYLTGAMSLCCLTMPGRRG